MNTHGKLFPCWWCGHPDNRDETHARGCPYLPVVPKETLIRRAREVEAAWAALPAWRLR